MRIFSTILMIVLSIGCNNEEAKEKNAVYINADTLRPDLPSKDDILRRFNLSYSPDALEDSAGMIFYSLNTFDTTYIIQIKSKGERAFVTYHYVSPNQHRGIYDSRFSKNDLLSFHGLSFTIPSRRWSEIYERVSKLVHSNDTLLKDPVCLDCPFFYLTSDKRYINSEKHNRNLFVGLERYLKDSLIFEHQRIYL